MIQDGGIVAWHENCITKNKWEVIQKINITEIIMTAREKCPTCMGKKIIEGACQVSAEWEGIKNEDQEQVCTPDNICSGQLCTTDNMCPTCNGKGYVGGED